MATLDLETLRENLEFRLARFDALPRPATPTLEYAEASLLAWRRARQLGIVALLAEADSVAFFAQLRRAARIRRDLLRLTGGAPKPFLEYRTAGDLAGFADALTAGEVALAAEIAALTTDGFAPDFEHEDDFWFARVLHELIAGTEARAVDALARLRAAAEDVPTAQVQVAAALIAKDGGAFATALSRAIDEHDSRFAGLCRSAPAEPERCASERFLFVEGLALKVAAAHRGIAVREEDPRMPREAWIGAAVATDSCSSARPHPPA